MLRRISSSGHLAGWRGRLSAALFLAAILALWGQQGKAPATPQGARRFGAERTREFLGLGPAPDAAAAERGAKLYAPNCAFCHGEKANGAEGPDLIRSSVVLHDEKGESIGAVVHSGRPDRGMPAFGGFTPEQLYDLAEFLHMRVYMAANRGEYKALNVVTGDAAAGKVYFDAHCASCHSTTGDLAHIGSKMQPADLQQAFLYPGARGYMPGAPRIEKVTVKLPSGESVSGTLKHLDDFNVSLVDASGEYRSFPRGPGVEVNLDDQLAAHRELLDRYTDSDMHNLTAFLAGLK